MKTSPINKIVWKIHKNVSKIVLWIWINLMEIDWIQFNIRMLYYYIMLIQSKMLLHNLRTKEYDQHSEPNDTKSDKKNLEYREFSCKLVCSKYIDIGGYRTFERSIHNWNHIHTVRYQRRMTVVVIHYFRCSM